MTAWAVLGVVLVASVLPCAARARGREETTYADARKLELGNGFFLEVPKENATGRLLSFGVDLNKNVEEGRSKQKKLLTRLLPMFIMPFLIQSAIIPMFLGMLKFMLFKSMMVGKLALGLIALNAFRNHNNSKARKDDLIADVHYGYHGNGMEEYGAYINK